MFCVNSPSRRRPICGRILFVVEINSLLNTIRAEDQIGGRIIFEVNKSSTLLQVRETDAHTRVDLSRVLTSRRTAVTLS